MEQNFMIKDFCFPTPTVSNNTDAKDRESENLFIFGPSYLDNFYYKDTLFCERFSLKSEMECLMFALPYVANYFEVDKNKLLQNWTNDYGYFRFLKFKGDIKNDSTGS